MTDLESAIRDLVGERRDAVNLAARLVAAVRVNALRGTFLEATYEQVDAWLEPFITTLRQLQRPDDAVPEYDAKPYDPPQPPPGPKPCPIEHNEENRHFLRNDYCALCEQPWQPT